MKRKIITVILLLISSFILIKLVFSSLINNILIVNYKNEVYNESLVKSLYILNFSESYIAYYNHGNILFKNSYYDEAINKYQDAIDNNPPKKLVCDIRVNLSIAMMYSSLDKNPEDAKNLLEDAKSNLTENGCDGSNDSTGNDEEKEKQKDTVDKIDEMLDGLNNNQNNTEIDMKEEMLKEFNKEASKSRQDELESAGESNYNFNKKRW